MIFRRQVEQLLNSDGIVNTVTATLHWRTVTGRGEGYNPADESSAAGLTITPGSMVFRAFFHRVDHRLSAFQKFLEVRTGDVILDYLTDLQLAGKDDCRIEVNGNYYVMKNASVELLEAWEVANGTEGTLKSLLLSPAP